MAFGQLPALHVHPKYLVAGPLKREFVILSDGKYKLDTLGGPGAYAACGVALWDQPVGLTCRVGEDYPHEWLEDLNRHQIDTRGVKILSQVMDLRHFTGYTAPGEYETSNPVRHFARHAIPFPSILLNYTSPQDKKLGIEEIQPTSPRSNDIPKDFLDATAAHICAMDYLTQSLLQPVLRSGEVKTITIDAHASYMQPEYFNKLAAIVSGLTAFMVNENDLRLFFRNRTSDIVEMASSVANLGCEMVIIHLADGNKLLYESTTRKKWLVPLYPSTRINYHTAQAAFGGGVLAGYRTSFDPVQALKYGIITESIAAEGLHPLNIFESLPGLAQARINALDEMIRLI